MGLRSTSDAWGAVSRWLHWTSAAVIIFGLTHGYWMANMLPRPQRLPHYWFHSLVFVYFGLLLLLVLPGAYRSRPPFSRRKARAGRRRPRTSATLRFMLWLLR